MQLSTSLRILTVALLVSGCSSVPLKSMVQLSRIDIKTTDLSVLRVALRLPTALRPKAQGVNLDVVTKVSGEADDKTTYFLAESLGTSDLNGLPPSETGTATYAFGLSPADQARFAALRATAHSKKDSGKSVSIGLGVAAKEFCRVGNLPVGPILATTYLRTAETSGYIVVTKDIDLMDDKSLAAKMVALEPCP